MTREREDELLATKDNENLVLGYMREAFLYARKCCRGKLPQDEIFSLCYKALAHAAKNFKRQNEAQRFFGFAKIYVRGEIAREWKRKDVVRNSSSHETLPPVVDPDDADSHDGDKYHSESNFLKARKPMDAIFPVTQPDWEGLCAKDLISELAPMIKGRLTNQEQLVMAMHYSQDLSFSEVSRLLGVSREAIRSTHTAALKKLRSALGANERLLVR